jgi:esterase/lipase
MIGGFASVFAGDYNPFEGGSIISKIIVEGLKWGGITFLLGIMVAALTSISTFWEKSSEKQRILKNISFMKNQKEKEKESTRKEFEKKIEKLKEHYETEIKKYLKENEDMTQEMQLYSEELRAAADERIVGYKTELEKILAC